MSDSWTNITPPRVASTDPASAADVNSIMADLRLLKGGVAGATPTTNIEAEAAKMITAQADILAVQPFAPWAYSAPDGTEVNLTVASKRHLSMKPSADTTIDLPTTGIATTDVFHIVNNGYKVLTIRSSGENVIGYLHHGSVGVFAPLQATPTTAAHWGRSLIHKKKLYAGSIAGTAYTNGTLTITMNQASPTITYGGLLVEPIGDGDVFAFDLWIDSTGDSTNNPTWTISNVTQGPVVYASGSELYNSNAGAVYMYGAVATVNANGVTSAKIAIRGTFSAKPTWMD